MHRRPEPELGLAAPPGQLLMPVQLWPSRLPQQPAVSTSICALWSPGAIKHRERKPYDQCNDTALQQFQRTGERWKKSICERRGISATVLAVARDLRNPWNRLVFREQPPYRPLLDRVRRTRRLVYHCTFGGTVIIGAVPVASALPNRERGYY